MKWIELIRVRSSTTALEEEISSLLKDIREIDESANAEEAFVMRHGLYEGDLAVVMVWKNGVEPVKTREGLLLAERLRDLGQINHAVWILQTSR